MRQRWICSDYTAGRTEAMCDKMSIIFVINSTKDKYKSVQSSIFGQSYWVWFKP